MVIEHGRPHIDEPIHPLGAGKQPALAMTAETMPGRTVNSPITGSPSVTEKFGVGNAALNENALALMRWHPVQ